MKKNKKKNKNLAKSRERIENWKNIGGSLFSNQRAIDAARHNPWWVAVIIFILSVFLPLIPILTQGFTSAGSDLFNVRTYNFDVTGTALVMDMAEKDVKLLVLEEPDGSKKLVDQDRTWENTYGTDIKDNKIQYSYVNSNTNQYDLLAFYTNIKGEDFVKLNNDIATRRYIVGSKDIYVAPAEGSSTSSSEATSDSSSSEEKPIETYTPNYILMNPETFVLQIFKPNTTQPFTQVFGDYTAVKAGTMIKDLAIVNSLTPSLDNAAYMDGVFNNWKSFLDDSFLANRNHSTMTMSLIASAIFAVLGFFMGLMIFLLTRGKRNMFAKILNFGVCQKIQAWSMFTPSILGMIFGFLLPAQGSIMFFIIFLGVRIMWMSMKQLRPQIR